ncbi:MAG: ATP-binding cassette domain-containing protein, partial [Rubrivivax sp.]
DIDARVKRAAEILELGPYLDRKPRALSGGQRQRVAMGRAIVREPKVFLFDEPLSNLDAALRSSVRGEIRALHQRSRTTSVYVTHDQVEAMTMGDRIVVLRGGRIEQVGTPVELYERPINRFVAGFIGSPAMNFVELPVQRDAAGVHVRWGDARLPLPAGLAGNAERVVVGVRPEHLRLAPDGAAPQPGHSDALQSFHAQGVAARVLAVEFTGAQSQIELMTAAGPVSVCAAERPLLKTGDDAVLQLPLARLHAFDAGSGLRLAA